MKVSNPLILFLIIVFSLLLSTNDIQAQLFKSKIRRNIVNFAEDCIGIPYKYGGYDKTGFDCSGFVYYVFTTFNKTIPRTSQSQYEYGRNRKRAKRVKAGDLIFFSGADSHSGKVNHSGIIVSNKHGHITFIHSSSSKGIMISKLEESYWKQRYLGSKNVL